MRRSLLIEFFIFNIFTLSHKLILYWFMLWNTSDATAKDTKIFAFQAIGLLAQRMPQLFRFWPFFSTFTIFILLSGDSLFTPARFWWFEVLFQSLKLLFLTVSLLPETRLTWPCAFLVHWKWSPSPFASLFRRRLFPFLVHIR